MESSSPFTTKSQDHESALLTSATKATITPDDSSVSALPRGQVDYLSHNWEEEDVWRSWQKMTRHHGDIADAVRLENASWRIWWKKRNKLKTVAPETLNWRKDADVTWLYGPLHTAEDWAPSVQPQRPKHDHSESVSTQADRPGCKSILKHRTLSELLTSELRPSSFFTPAESENEDSASDNGHSSSGDSRPGVSFLGPCSEEIATNRSAASAGRHTSQPHTRPGTPSLANRQSNNATQKKKQISFNTVVEQFIAIEKPNIIKPKPKYWDPRSWNYGDEYAVDENNNTEETDETWDGRTRHPILSGCAIADSDSDEDRGSDGEGNSGGTTNQPRTNSPIKNIPQKPVPRPRAVSASAPTSPSSSTPFLPIPRPISPSQLRQKDQVTSAQLSAYGLARRPGIGSPYLPRARLYSASRGESIRRGNEYGCAGAKASPHVRMTVAQVASTFLKDGYDGKAEGLGGEGDVVDDPCGGGTAGDKEPGEGLKKRNRKRVDKDGISPAQLGYIPPQLIGI